MPVSALHMAKFSSKRPVGRGGGGGGAARPHQPTNPRQDIKKLRFARILRDELSDIICTGDVQASSFPGGEHLLHGVMIVKIDLNVDFSVAKVYLSIMGNAVEKRRVFIWLNDNRGKVSCFCNIQIFLSLRSPGFFSLMSPVFFL